jgi:uncharacterized membrane protein
MTTSPPPPQDDHVYHMILFAFRGNKRAADVLDDIKKSQKLGGYKLLVQAVVERDVQGEVTIHEPGRGGVGGTAGAVAGGLLGLLGGPFGIVAMAVAGGVAGGVAGHFAGRAIPAEDLRRMGNALPPDSSGLIVLLEDLEAEKVINELEGYQAEVVTFTVGDELSGEIDSYIAADVTKTGSAASEVVTPAAPASPAPDATATPATPSA